MHVLPRALIEADRVAKWPSQRRLSGSLLSTAAPFMSGMDFELLTLSQISGKERSEIANLESLVDCAKTASTALVWQVYAGNNSQGPSDLPWLDLEKALVAGGGADYGDDTFIALDYRLDLSDPRVVISEYHHYGPEGARTASSQFTWFELAHNIQGLLAMLGQAR